MENDLQKLVIGGVARHVLTAIAGSLVAAGAIHSGSEQTQFVSIGCGVALWAAGIAWSWWNKQGHAALMSQVKGIAKPQR